MRISDWSSDVCSSDLVEILNIPVVHGHALLRDPAVATRICQRPYRRRQLRIGFVEAIGIHRGGFEVAGLDRRVQVMHEPGQSYGADRLECAAGGVRTPPPPVEPAGPERLAARFHVERPPPADLPEP